MPGLIALLAEFGLSERLVRTSIFRLARQGWLAATPVGRRSLYRLTPEGDARFERAFRRVYAPPADRWDGSWEIALLRALPPAERRRLGAEMGWAGFGHFAPGVFARPVAATQSRAVLAPADALASQIITLRAHAVRLATGAPLASLVAEAWDLEGVAAEYQRFLR